MAGTKLSGRYLITRHLGGGGFGQTYLAQDTQLPGSPFCVVKQLKPQSADPATLQLARRLFDQEVQALYRLGTHDQIPKLLAHIEENQGFYLVQEFIEGDTLDQELAGGRRFSQSDVITLMREMLEVLAFVHRQGVIHRDIKPANLIRRKSDGRIVLIDFGAVKQVGAASVTTSGSPNLTIAIGSQGYMPGEQLAGRPQFSSDVYAVGMVCIQALTGVTPDQLRQSSRTGELIWQDRVQVNPHLASLINKMARFDFRQRFSSAAEALEALMSVSTFASAGPQATTTAVTAASVFNQSSSSGFNSDMRTLPPTEFGSQYQYPHGNSGLQNPPEPNNSSGLRSLIMIIAIFVLLAGAMGAVVWVKGSGKASQSSARNESNVEPVSTTADPSAVDSDLSFKKGLAYAGEARSLSQTAKTKEEWEEVSQKWEQAIQSMQEVQQTSPNYRAAQLNMQEYQLQLAFAKQQALQWPSNPEATAFPSAEMPPPAQTSPPPPTLTPVVMPPQLSERTYLSLNFYEVSKGNNLKSFTTEHGFFDASVGNSGAYSESVNVRFKGPKDGYDLSLKAPGGERLQRGTYENAQRYPFQATDRPGLDFNGSGGCNTLTGRFMVYEIVYGSDGEIELLDVVFERRCTGSTAIIYGRLRYDRRDQR